MDNFCPSEATFSKQLRDDEGGDVGEDVGAGYCVGAGEDVDAGYCVGAGEDADAGEDVDAGEVGRCYVGAASRSEAGYCVGVLAQ